MLFILFNAACYSLPQDSTLNGALPYEEYDMSLNVHKDIGVLPIHDLSIPELCVINNGKCQANPLIINNPYFNSIVSGSSYTYYCIDNNTGVCYQSCSFQRLSSSNYDAGIKDFNLYAPCYGNTTCTESPYIDSTNGLSGGIIGTGYCK